MAYSISRGGADWQEIYVMDVASKNLLEDKIMDVKFSGTEWKDNEGFFYSTYKEQGGRWSGRRLGKCGKRIMSSSWGCPLLH